MKDLRQSVGFLLLAAALFLLGATGAHAQSTPRFGEGIPTLRSGRFTLDPTTQIPQYVTYAEERAIVNPAIVWEIRSGSNQLIPTQDIPFVPDRMPNSPRYREATDDGSSDSSSGSNNQRGATYTHTISQVPPGVSKTLQAIRRSTMQWWVTDVPFGASEVKGTKMVESTNAYQFRLEDVVFPIAGYYNIHYNISMYYGGYNFIYNQTVFVNKQPQTVALLNEPLGFNGTAFSPAPRVEFRDFFDDLIPTSTPIVNLTLLVPPIGGGELRGTTSIQADEGEVRFTNVIATLPGVYALRIDATLSDNSIISTASFQVTVQKALPTQIVLVDQPVGMARFLFTTQPKYSIRDAAGPSEDSRTNLTLSLFLNSPSVGYEGLDTVATLSGKRWALPVDYEYSYSDLMIDLPGRYEIEAELLVDGTSLLTSTVGFEIQDPPTWEQTAGLTVNTLGDITVYGVRPSYDVVNLRLSRDLDCSETNVASNTATWPLETEGTIIRNISFTPFRNGNIYLCMQIPASQPAYVPLIKYYLPSFNELFPLVYDFFIADVAECAELGAEITLAYRLAGWDTAKEGRRYGCRLSPPVNGTIPPCTCPTILSCENFEHPSFTPSNLDIGRCVCCKPWVMALAGIFTTIFLLGLLFVIYQWA